MESKMRGSISKENADIFKEKHPVYKLFLAFLDFLFSAFIVTPLAVGYWRSLWELMGIYVYPDNQEMSSIVSTIIGVFGNIVLCLIQHEMMDTFHPDKNRVIYYIISRTYSVIFAFVCINGFRGPWQLLDEYSAMDKVTVTLTTALGIVILVSLKSLRNISAPPFVVAPDNREGYFEVLTIFRISASDKTILYILDCLFSILVIGTLVVFVWRGGWVILDLFVYPEDFTKSSWVTLILGYILVAVAFLMQPLMKWICENISGTARLIVADLFLLFTFFATINTWRGIWNLLNIYFLPDNLELSCWITYWVCLVLLILLGCSNSLLVRGVYIDAEEPGGECVVFPCHYLRNILANQRRKKILANIKLGTEHKLKNVKIITVKENHNANVGKSQQKNEIANHKENQ